MDESVFKDGFGNHAQPSSQGHQNHELGLHVRRESRIRLGFDIDTPDSLRPRHPESISIGLNLHTRFSQFMNRGLHMLRGGIENLYIAAG